MTGVTAYRIVNDVQNTTLADIIRRNTRLTKLQEDVFFFNESTVIVDEAPATTQQPFDQAQGGNNQNGRQPPQAAINACTGLAENSSCSFIGRNQTTVNGTCLIVSSSTLACVPAGGPPRP